MKKFLVCAILTAVTTPAFAQDADLTGAGEAVASSGYAFGDMSVDHFEIGYGASIFGNSLVGAVQVNPMFALRGIVGEGKIDIDVERDDLSLVGDLAAGGNAMFLDVYPMEGAFRVSLGAARLRHNLDMTTTGSVEIGGDTYTSTVVFDGEADKSIVPVISTGFNTSLGGSNFNLFADIGAMYIGGINVTVTNPDGQIPVADLDAEFADDINDLKAIDYAPFINLGVTLSF